MLGTGLPVLLSTGMSPIAEIDRAVERCRRHFVPFAVMQCASSYPCPPEAVGLNLIQLFKVRYGCPVGLSDHSGTIFPALAAATMGVSAIEVHVTLSREMFGPDVPASVTTGELRQLVEGVRFIERMTASPVDKDAAAAAMSGMRALFTKSVVPRVDLSAGAILRREDLALKKPGTGIPAVHLPRVLGRRLKRDVCVDQLMTEDDLEIAEP
jgi:N-acetylneuraminate synthase